MSYYAHPNPHTPRHQPSLQPPSNTHHSGSYSMTRPGSQESNSSSNSGHTYSSQSSQSPSSSTPSYSHHANSYGSPAPRGGDSGSSPRYPCLFQGCMHTSARPYDLDRHQKTHYPDTVARLDCPFARGGFCGREGERGFTREDHRKEHVRKVHPVRR